MMISSSNVLNREPGYKFIQQIELRMTTSMDFPTLPYDDVTHSFLLEIWFWGPTYPTFLYNVTLFTLFHLRKQL